LFPTSTPDLRNTMPVAFRLMVAPRQNNHTASTGNVPVMIPLVNEPK
jgi:hypothetical protein